MRLVWRVFVPRHHEWCVFVLIWCLQPAPLLVCRADTKHVLLAPAAPIIIITIAIIMTMSMPITITSAACIWCNAWYVPMLYLYHRNTTFLLILAWTADAVH